MPGGEKDETSINGEKLVASRSDAVELLQLFE